MSDKLRNLLRVLDAALQRFEGALAQPVNEFVRDSAIQRFEFTFELFWKSLKAYAEESGLEAYSPRDSLRTAFQLGLIQECSDWFRMLEDRNLTSHTYNEATAETIYSHLPAYLLLIRQAHRELLKRVKS
ncbi:MAG: nucleotidyltransferase substrate binding protein [Nitrospira sp.]|nr:nucleotidyltransferase substrate binding protein [Nitrospira sp.]MCP9442134.1 nucleotidyltransferase substrate binding protein [Nitrospira sp.]